MKALVARMSIQSVSIPDRSHQSSLVVEDRIAEIQDAAQQCGRLQLLVPQSWLDELSELQRLQNVEIS